MKNLTVEFIDNYKEKDYKLKYVVIPAKYKGKWVFVRHNERSTWEVPGGHIEEGETPMEAAKREIYEETGAVNFTLNPICLYNVKIDNSNSYGILYFADIEKLTGRLEYEIEEITLLNKIPHNLTYPNIQPKLFEKAKEYLNSY